MCGIVGQFTCEPNIRQYNPSIKMLTGLMKQRGPDDEGLWSDEAHCTLGFRRLSILDLTPSGHQPMQTPDDRYVLMINGEVYNFQELKSELGKKGRNFRSSGDAEVVLYALVEWGKKALSRFNGMFALAFYDRLEKKLLLARDYSGSKPLYYLHDKRGIVFASQYDQIMAHSWTKGLSINQSALATYLRFGYIPAPYAIINHTHLLEAGCWLEMDTTGATNTGRYFEFPTYQEPDLHGIDAYEAVDSALVNAVRRQLVSDVPVGCFLSGGIDSPLVTAIAQSLCSQPIKTFTIKVADAGLDESADAAIYAKQISVEHQIETIRFDNIENLVWEITEACSEPFGDYSIIPTHLIAKVASKQVKVAISGDGGDELFWGYTGRMGKAIKNAHLFKLPFLARKLRWWILRRPNEWNVRYFKTAGEWYRSTHEHNFESWLKELFPAIASFPESYHHYHFTGNSADQFAQWVRWNEFSGHMGFGLLKVDRGSMYNSLEVRTPILDREVIATAARVDWRSCIDLESGIGKLPLRHALAKRVRHQTAGKRGFEVPIGEWLRGPLRSMFEDLVIGRGELLGLEFDKKKMTNIYKQHLDGQFNHEWGLWLFLSLALWETTHYKKWTKSLC